MYGENEVGVREYCGSMLTVWPPTFFRKSLAARKDILSGSPLRLNLMLLDLVYCALAIVFLGVCWGFTKACEHL